MQDDDRSARVAQPFVHTGLRLRLRFSARCLLVFSLSLAAVRYRVCCCLLSPPCERRGIQMDTQPAVSSRHTTTTTTATAAAAAAAAQNTRIHHHLPATPQQPSTSRKEDPDADVPDAVVLPPSCDDLTTLIGLTISLSALHDSPTAAAAPKWTTAATQQAYRRHRHADNHHHHPPGVVLDTRKRRQSNESWVIATRSISAMGRL
ncbi:hypothetical protein POJ06DRAFT_22629 [Lipomyces tetrasporus]|uniref:Uncharacterized protein n=1 Tax=Lipomyces tetrasporus TaxID=54092 RepID=A0AAD7VQE2_9ASCO|nr:uncharacterized protein POJ06DRAFT_22629 [Lipomyces tetrasporus]KAJ8097796.1 hypothetical protein POJ06DRAFT_22629 [Lipomyces tetrasporus]